MVHLPRMPDKTACLVIQEVSHSISSYVLVVFLDRFCSYETIAKYTIKYIYPLSLTHTSSTYTVHHTLQMMMIIRSRHLHLLLLRGCLRRWVSYPWSSRPFVRRLVMRINCAQLPNRQRHWHPRLVVPIGIE